MNVDHEAEEALDRMKTEVGIKCITTVAHVIVMLIGFVAGVWAVAALMAATTLF